MDNKELVLDLSSLSKQKIKIKDGDEMRDLYLNLSDLNIITRYNKGEIFFLLRTTFRNLIIFVVINIHVEWEM